MTIGEQIEFEDPPTLPFGPLSEPVEAALEQLFGPTLDDRFFDVDEREALDVLGESEDVRLGWVFSDLLRFVFGEDTRPRVVSNALQVADLSLQPQDDWQRYTDHLIAWDVPAPPVYFEVKKRLYTLVEPRWEPLFDETGEVDWRYVSWGGVLIDDRPFGDTEPCPASCIPAADNPTVTDTAGGAWYPDDRLVFGVEIGGETRAYPKHIMEIREMVNDTLGGRDFAMPYCTLCGSAQVFLTDDIDGFDRPILRTSGLLNRSNKVMYDLNTKSVFDTFAGTAVTGPLADAGVILPQISVATTTWGAWKAEHPNTTILTEDLDFDNPNGLDPLRGRDDNGPIFPIGDVDPRLPVQEPILGVISPDSGKPIAFHVAIAAATLQNGGSIEVDGIVIEPVGSGIRALDADGNDLGSHQSFWFAWSQFNPDTSIWPSG
ncbi:MAG: DUF3179 domain-containing (seleno)protein [Acidimicrobiales bacterium]